MKDVETNVPVVPARLLKPLGENLERFYILWEVKHWKAAPERDPTLLKRITDNMFAVFAVWNIIDLERSIVKG
jgi:hypothetical protein